MLGRRALFDLRGGRARLRICLHHAAGGGAYSMPGHTRTGASHLYRMGLVVILTMLALSASYLPSSAAEHAPPGVVAPQQSQVGYVGPAYGSGANSTPTGEKPESKLWWNDGRWWGAMFSQAAGDYRIFWLDLSTQTWHDTALRSATGTKTRSMSSGTRPGRSSMSPRTCSRPAARRPPRTGRSCSLQLHLVHQDLLA